MRRLWAVTWARSVEFLRDRSALGWNLLFPVLMVVGMATVFSGPERPIFNVGVIGEAEFTAATHPFFATEGTRFHHEDDEAAAVAKVERHRNDLLLDLRVSPARYWVNPESQRGRLLERLLRASDPQAVAQAVSGRAIRYVDWLVPGILGVNMMFSCMFGIGYVIVRYRKSGYLKRLNATPLRAVEFITAQMLSRLILILVVTTGVYTGCNLFLHFRMEGHYVDLFVVAALGAISMIALSLMIAARISSEELSGGILNLLSWPMMMLSGVFFPLDGAPQLVQTGARVFPLTHMLEAARAIMLDGAGLAAVSGSLAVLAAMTGVFLVLGAGLFRWTQD
ncbi:MAG: ABC transporter permease [Nevskiales bacterium]|nr:ABC transporter permease [Nevskiales bacterium]